MNSVPNYEAAIRALNGLQSNAAVLSKKRHIFQMRPEVNIDETATYLERTGVKVSDLDRLNVIHVAGTKGKGSVCAMTESILRHHGLKTGFYSSPHLVHVRERIRINGHPISEEKFAYYFWLVYDKLEKTKVTERTNNNEYPSMPAYFKFLTILAFHVFLGEKVDVAVMEVGIGGAYDCTNVLRHPVVCGITTLDYDHMNVLGDTLEEIAWQKAGIMKPGSIAVTMDQPPSCLNVLSQRSKELECPLYVCPPFSDYTFANGATPAFKLGIPGQHQLGNGSLALQLAHLWFERRDNRNFIPETRKDGDSTIPELPAFILTPVHEKALGTCRWSGRSQTLVKGDTTFYLDGAHTPKSMEACADWFRDVTRPTETTGNSIRILIFNCTSGRKPESLLKYLSSHNFDCAIFCPNMVYTTVDATADQADMRTSHEKQMEVCEENRRGWLSLHSNDHSSLCSTVSPNSAALFTVPQLRAVNGKTLMAEFADGIDWRGHYPDASLQFSNFSQWTRSNGVCPSTNKVTAVFPCISSALEWITSLEKSVKAAGEHRLQVLVTGSLHLVGGVLAIIDPDLKM